MNKDEEKLFEQMSLLSNSDDEEGFLFFVDTHQELLKVDPIKFIGLHVSFYGNKEDVLKSLQVVEYYKSAPYISMEVEDFLNELKSELTKVNQGKNVDYSEEEIEKFLFSNNENAIVSGLHILSKKNIRNHLKLMKKFLSSDIPSKYKSLGLFILIEQHIDEEIFLNKDGMEYNLNPSLLTLPFDDYVYLDVIKYLEQKNENIEIIEGAKEILNTVQIKNYPDSILDEDNIELMGEIFIAITKKFMSLDFSLKNISTTFAIDEYKIIALIEEIIEIFNS